ncbi:DUF2428 domain-containing protein [Psidium guajava]|nr:DUF2428 domain-containing protein [Psidium guajava]
MSAKWRALQHRHRYTYSAVVFPQPFVDSLADESSSHPRFYGELQELTSLNSTYSQVNHVKRVASSFGDVLSSAPNDQSLSKAARLYLEIMFFENSTPLHRTLVSALAKARNHQDLICRCFRALCEEYGGSRGKGKWFCVSRAALSIMGMPKLGYLMGVVEDCAVVVARDIAYGLSSVVLETTMWARPSPVVMEQCQEALSCLYYLLQKFPSQFNDLHDKGVMEMIVHVVLSILKLSSFSRDCLVAAGVSFCAALQVCLSAEELGLFIVEGIFQGSRCSGSICESEISEIIMKIQHRGNFYHEICSFSALSRLCLIRGILTAVSRNVLNMPFVVASDKLNGCEDFKAANKVVKTILYDGILPELCNFCENPTDSHFNFHALTVMQICLQQIKTSLLAKLANFSEDYDPLKEEMGTRILRLIWKNLEDPLSQTVKQVHMIFDLFLDIQSTLHWGDSSDKIKLFLRKIASDLLHLGPRCKGRYVPLASLTKRLGARALLGMSPGLLSETVQAYIDDDVCCAATSFLKCFLENLRDDCWKTDGIERGYVLYREHCLHPFLYGLASGASKLRSNLNTYALPVLLEVDIDSIFPMLAFISVTPTGEDDGFSHLGLNGTRADLSIERKVAVVVSLLKVSRLLALIEGDIDWLENTLLDRTVDRLEAEYVSDYAVVCIKGIRMKILVEWLVQALTHVDDSLRVDAAEFLFLNPKTASLPSHLELVLMKEAIPLNMRCSSTAFQMKWCSLFRKFFARVRTALERQLKQQAWRPRLHHKGTRICLSIRGEETSFSRADDLFCFMRWLSAFLFFSCYPSAPYKRKIMAMELMVIMMDVWDVAPSSQENHFLSPESLHPYSRGITSPDSTFLFVASIVDSWDRLRENSFRILLHFPTPLPGLSSDEMVVNIIEWAKKLVCSPRVRESDAGALTLRLIFRKYVLEQRWIVRASVNVMCDSQSHPSESMHPVMDYVWSLIYWLDVAVEEGKRDLSEACKNSFVHGILLSLRYTFEELDWNSDAVVSSMSEMRRALNKLLDLVLEITSLALWVVSADAWYLPEDMDEIADDGNFVLDFPVEVNDPAPPSEWDKCSNVGLEQVVMVGCWLAMKEVSLLLGTIIRKIPLPTSTCSDSLEPNDGTDISAMKIPEAVLDLKQLEAMGNHFLEVLLKMKHNGAIDKTRAGFTALCNRLLCSNDPELCRLTESWMELLMERTVAKGQVVDDLLRRSAGIPAAFIALFLSEPEGAPKKLLPCALRWLIDVASQSLQDLTASTIAIGDPCIFSPEKIDHKAESALPVDSNAKERTSKIRDEGVIPTVHAFNVLRTAFNDTNLATDTSGFCAEALIVSIRAFSSPYWEVRNSACLAYTALMRRMIGFLNVHKRESARRSLTGLEFFHRYPSLHLFLLEELKVATELLDDGSTRHSESSLAKVVHPSLCPVLILLSRLKPSAIASEIDDDLDPFLFMPFIRRCSTQRNMRIRVLASRALTGLVSNEKLLGVIVNIATELSYLENHCRGIAIPHMFSTTNEAQHTPFNLIHGMLLQLCSLLDTNCKNLIDVSKKDQILSDLIQLLVKCSWIGSPRWCPCPPVNTTFLRVLDHMLSVARGCRSGETIFDIRNLLLELTAECLDLDGSCMLPYYDPAVPELREQSATSYFSCFFQISNEKNGENIYLSQKNGPSDSNLLEPETLAASCQLQEKLVCCLSDSLYEVRLATLKWLLKFLRIMESGCHGHYFSRSEIAAVQQWTNVNLQDTLMKLMSLEKYHKCTNYILRIFFTWNLQQYNQVGSETDIGTKFVGVMDCDSVLQIWGRLLSLYNIVRHAKTWGTLICCMAVCIKRLAGLLANSIFGRGKTVNECLVQVERQNQLYGCISMFNKLIELHSTSSEPVSMRNAAVESIIASGMLEQAEVIGPLFRNKMPAESRPSFSDTKEIAIMYAHQVLKMWFTCVRLLEDEDDGIRQKLASNVQKCFTLRHLLGRSSAFSVPTQVEKVLKLSFEHLSSIFGHWIEYFNYLSQWVLDVEKYEKSRGDLVRRVFDKEIDNHHEEKLLICQICCLHMEKLFISSSWALNLTEEDGIRKNLCAWRMRFFTQLIMFGEDHMTREDDVFWIGGVGNHKDAFLPLYANLLGFYALSKCLLSEDGIPSDPELASDVVKLAKALSLFLRNPLILNLFCLVVELHDRKLHISADISMLTYRTDDLLWDSFDPYFLLK